MADTEIEQSCRFRWKVVNPFFPCKTMSATFCRGIPHSTLWKVSILPLKRDFAEWKILFSLECVPSDDTNSISCDIDVEITVDGIHPNLNVKSEHDFKKPEFETYQIILELQRQIWINSLEFEVSMTLKRVQEVDLYPDYLTDTTVLSRDMARLCSVGERYSNMTLISKNPRSELPVHSCIMRARCSELFEGQNANAEGKIVVETDISREILDELLLYLYAGRLTSIGMFYTTDAYTAEMFQVINRYKIHHLYDALTHVNSWQERTTTNHAHTFIAHFPARRDSEGRGARVCRSLFVVNEGTDCEFVFQFRGFVHLRDPYIRCSMVSRSDRRIFVRVHVGFERADEGSKAMHERETWLSPRGELNFRVDFERDLPELVDLRKGGSLWVMCILHSSTGESVEQLAIKGRMISAYFAEGHRERIMVVADCMARLKSNDTDKDIKILCRSLNNEETVFSLHKAILEARVPGDRDINFPILLPDEWELGCSSEAFECIADFIYKGKIHEIPSRFRREVHDFAEQYGTQSLMQLVFEMNRREEFLQLLTPRPRPLPF